MAKRDEDDATESSVSTPGSGQRRRTSNSDGMPLTKSGRISMSKNKVNSKYDTSYSNSDDTNKLLGRNLNLGQAFGIVGGALHCAEIPLEDSGKLSYCAYLA